MMKLLIFGLLLAASPAAAACPGDVPWATTPLLGCPIERAIERQTFQQHLDADVAAQDKIYSDGLARRHADENAELNRPPTRFDTYCYPGGICTTYGR